RATVSARLGNCRPLAAVRGATPAPWPAVTSVISKASPRRTRRTLWAKFAGCMVSGRLTVRAFAGLCYRRATPAQFFRAGGHACAREGRRTRHNFARTLNGASSIAGKIDYESVTCGMHRVVLYLRQRGSWET